MSSTNVPSWIPQDPNEFLHPIHFKDQRFEPHDWDSGYAPGRYCYSPEFLNIAKRIFGNKPQAGYVNMISSVWHLAEEIIPTDLKNAISVQQYEWSSLPPEQIKYALSGRNMGFAKSTLCLVSLQILVFILDGGCKSSSIDAKGQVTIARDLIEKLKAYTPKKSRNVIKASPFYLAVYGLIDHDKEFWTEKVFSDPNIVTKFGKFTGQHSPKFRESFADGELCTLPTLATIKTWCSNAFPEIQQTGIHYVHNEVRRVRAARKEKVMSLTQTTLKSG